MGSLLPGWDSDPFTPPMGVGVELHEEKLSLEKELHSGGRRNSVDHGKTAQEGPVLTRKSAPSSIIVKKLQQTFPSDDDSPMLPLTAEFIDEEMESDEDVTPSTANSLYMRDKWWRKFSSAHLNEMAKEVETDSAKHTYTPQFDLAGGDPYLKKA